MTCLARAKKDKHGEEEMSRSRVWVLGVMTALLAISCGGEVSVEEAHEHHDAIDHGATELLYVYDRDEASERFIDGIARFQPTIPFQSAVIMITGKDLEISAATTAKDEAPTQWGKITLESHDEGFYRALIRSPEQANELFLRLDAGEVDFVRVEFWENPIESADALDDLHGHSSEGQAIAKPGSWSLPSATRRKGESQYVPYTYPGSRCTGSLLPGSAKLGKFLVQNFAGAKYYQGYNCRSIRGGSGLSMHSVGRAVDVFIPLHRGQADNDLGDPVANYLVENAEALGIQFIIWDRTKWSGSYSGRKDRYYDGVHPHHDHLHIELTPRAASGNLRFPPVKKAPKPFKPYFSDDDNSKHEAAINALKKEGVISGCRGGDRPRFCPSDSVTRRQLAIMLRRALKLPKPTRDYFRDDNGTTGEYAINAITEAGITVKCGGSDVNFCPDRPVSRAAFAVMLRRAFQFEFYPYDFYNDDNGTYYERSANSLRMAGIIKGCGGKNFCGDKPVTRAQAATMLARALELVPRVDTPYFADDDGNPHEEAINALFAAGVVKGCGWKDGKRLYCPDRAITRAEMATVLDRAFDFPRASTDYFVDDNGSTHERHINDAARAGIIKGCNAAERKYCPNMSMRRKNVALMLDRLLNLPDTDRDFFDDDDGLYYEAAANRVAAAGITRGCGKKRMYCGDDVVTRAQVATFVWRSVQY